MLVSISEVTLPWLVLCGFAEGWRGWVDLGDWLHTVTVFLPADGGKPLFPAQLSLAILLQKLGSKQAHHAVD